MEWHLDIKGSRKYIDEAIKNVDKENANDDEIGKIFNDTQKYYDLTYFINYFFDFNFFLNICKIRFFNLIFLY